jgi:hypothetical protein
MQYISQCTLTVNGQDISDFKGVGIKEVTLSKQVNLMNKTGFVKTKPRYGVTVDYVVPQTVPPFDFEAVVNGTLNVTFENGRKYAYTGVHTIKVGEIKLDQENEVVQTIEFGCEDRSEKP